MAPRFFSHGQQVGLVVAAASVPPSFARSLSQRTWKDQGLVTGLSAGTTFLLTVITQDAIDTIGAGLGTALPFPEKWSLEQRERAGVLLADALAIPAGQALSTLVSFDYSESSRRSLLRQAGFRLSLVGIGGVIAQGSDMALSGIDSRLDTNGWVSRIPLAIPLGLLTTTVNERIRQRNTLNDPEPDLAHDNPLLALAAAGGVVVSLAGLTFAESLIARELGSLGDRVLPGSQRFWTRAGHLAALGALTFGTQMLWQRTMHRIESGTSGFESSIGEGASGTFTHPNMSGDPASLVSWDGLGREGRRHAVSYVRPARGDAPQEFDGKPAPDLSIKTVMEQEAKTTPIQVFVGLDNATTLNERVELALAEMDRTDAWSRSLIALVSPTGTGYVNYVAIACLQYMTLGDVVSVTLQYSKRPSPLSLGKVGDAKEQNRLLWLRILERVRLMEPAMRPKVVVFGESLGAQTSQAVFEGWGTLGPEALGIDRALWIGTPAGSRWSHELRGPDRPGVDKDIIAVVNDYEQFLDVQAKATKDIRFVLLSHDNDGVTKFSPDLLVKRPPWLGSHRPVIEDAPGRSPRGIPSSMRWRPVTTFFQSLVDMKNAQIKDGYKPWAHDYRPDLPDFIRDVFALGCTDEQLERIKNAVQEREEFRESILGG